MERYDNIEYGFEDNFQPMNIADVTTTDKDGFITSQQYNVRESENVSDDEMTEDDEPIKKPKKDRSSPRETVLVFQLAVCIFLAAAAFLIKNFGGELYENIRDLYYTNLNNSIIIDMNTKNNDEFVKNIKDELNNKKSENNI